MNKLISSVSPHFSGKRTTQNIMLDVIIALLPAAVASVLIFGWRSLLVIAVCVASCVASEFLFEKLCKRENTAMDLSAIVTGLLLAFNLPVSIPIWQAVFGSVVAIIVVKQLFGGIGQNFANPAITARIIMLTAFSGTMTSWVIPQSVDGVDVVSSATPLAAAAKGETLPSYLSLFLGTHGGCLGETCVLALLLGGLYLLARRVISWHTPVAFIATVALMSLICGKDVLFQLMSGGLVLGAFFMATDYATTPSTKWGKIIFGIGCGLITILIRFWGNLPEGVSFSILLMNILTPYISKLTRNQPLTGGAKK
ncbi:MAG: RnfABCDGE type electron transport complex subunit D [Clostridia bacterium]|nr:RnfABCDGE type electron transport complex subunit D [Clostridia bacterium]